MPRDAAYSPRNGDADDEQRPPPTDQEEQTTATVAPPPGVSSIATDGPNPYNYPPVATDAPSSAPVVVGVPIDDDGSGVNHVELYVTEDENGTRTLAVVHRPDGAPGAGPIAQMQQHDELELQALGTLYGAASTVRHCAMAEFVSTILYTFSLIYFLALLPFPVLGFVGGRRYNHYLVIAFLFFFPAAIGMRIYDAKVTMDTREDPTRSIVLVCYAITIIIDVCIFVYCTKFIRALTHAPEDVLKSLMEGWKPT